MTEKNETDSLQERKKESMRLLQAHNGVPGFDPNLFLHMSTDKDNPSKVHLYLPVDIARLWFFAKYEDGRIEARRVEYNAQKATVEVLLYENRDDMLAKCPKTNAIVTRYFNDKDVYGRDYLQNAVTAAQRKALSHLGFCAPPDAHIIEGITVNDDAVTGPGVPMEDLTEAGIVLDLPMPPIPEVKEAPIKVDAQANPVGNVEASSPEPKKRGRRKPQPMPQPEPESKPKPELQSPNQGLPVPPTAAPVETPQAAPEQDTQAPMRDEQLPVKEADEEKADTPQAEEKIPTTYEEACAHICHLQNSSALTGQTMGGILNTAGVKVIRIMSKSIMADEGTRVAAQIIWKEESRKMKTA